MSLTYNQRSQEHKIKNRLFIKITSCNFEESVFTETKIDLKTIWASKSTHTAAMKNNNDQQTSSKLRPNQLEASHFKQQCHRICSELHWHHSKNNPNRKIHMLSNVEYSFLKTFRRCPRTFGTACAAFPLCCLLLPGVTLIA